MWQVAAAQAVGAVANAAKAPPSAAQATGGYASQGVDHSNWNVQIGSGLNVAPGGLLSYLMLGGALLLAVKWLNKKG